MRHNSRLLLVGVLVIVFPLLFVWITQNFFTTAYTNITTSEKQRVTILHDSTSALLTARTDDETINNFLKEVITANDTIVKLRVIQEKPDGTLQVVYSANDSVTGQIEKNAELYLSADSTPGSSFIFEFAINDTRTWQVFRKLVVGDIDYYIFSEHSFAQIDAVMLSRQQESYMGLSAIFLFLIVLAIWLSRQIHWHREYLVASRKIEEQALFSNTIAHELRAPLTAIKGYVSFIEESDVLKTENKTYLGNIKSSTERLVVLINDFLEVARIQSGKLKVDFKNCDINSLLELVVDDFKASAREKNLELILVPLTENVMLKTDKARLQQIVTNILSNAIKYTDFGAINVSLEQTRHKTIIKIKDTGHGISAEDQLKLFSPFTRVGKADSTSITGSGLGMWITKQLVEQLQGKISIESIEDVGTHVKITFHQ